MSSDHDSWLAGLLKAAETAEPVAAVRVFAEELARQVDAQQVSFLIADFSGHCLIRMTQSARQGPGQSAAEQVLLSDEHLPYRAAIVDQQVRVVVQEGGVRVLVPVSSRGDAMGLLDVVLSQSPDAAVEELLSSTAHALALVVTSERRHTDLYEWGQRSRPLSLAGEIQQRLLPDTFTCEAAAFSLAAWLEPAGRVGGDTFDYSLDTDRLYLSMTDAMGHELDAALLATLAVSSLRSSRRAAQDLAQMARTASEVIDRQHQGLGFITGIVMTIDLTDGHAQIVNAGHPLPLLQRGGEVVPLQLEPDLPLGVLPEVGYQVQHLQLQPGDRLILLTDGMLERDAASVDLPGLIAENAELHPRQLMQVLTAAVDEAVETELSDDATALCLDWRGPAVPV